MEKETILGTLIRQLELSGFQELARVSGVPLRTLVRYDQQLAKEGRKTISSWKAENIIKLANFSLFIAKQYIESGKWEIPALLSL